jgi:hypothetical protein
MALHEYAVSAIYFTAAAQERERHHAFMDNHFTLTTTLNEITDGMKQNDTVAFFNLTFRLQLPLHRLGAVFFHIS